MSLAMAKAGLVTTAQSEACEGLQPYASIDADNKRIVSLLKEYAVRPDLFVLMTSSLCALWHQTGRHKEALEMMNSTLRDFAKKHNIPV
ncbi:MAG: hypothetical protein KBD24_03260 [Candidatus Pacebacteria bacterium]|nr:hypothetical protein [Candidatus Paceibacterota bacterium]